MGVSIAHIRLPIADHGRSIAFYMGSVPIAYLRVYIAYSGRSTALT